MHERLKKALREHAFLDVLDLRLAGIEGGIGLRALHLRFASVQG
jgi:hypothetical protein